MSQNFDYCFDILLENEGGFTYNVADRGNATNWGICLATLQAWRKNTTITAQDVASLTQDEAKQIYFDLYWTPLNLEMLVSTPKALVIFDQAVLCGVKTSAKRAQKISNLLNDTKEQDGIIGDNTIESINKCSDIAFCLEFLIESLNYFEEIVKKNATQAVFLNGWKNRIYRLMRITLEKTNAE